MDALLALLAHELRTPLQLALGLQEQLEDALESDVRVERPLVAQLAGAYERLSGAIEAVIAAGSQVGGSLPRRDQDVCLATVLRDAVEVVEPLAAERTVTICQRLPVVPPLLCTDEARLGQVLVGLLKRAIGQAPAGAEVCVRSFELPGRVGLAIEQATAAAEGFAGGFGLFVGKRLVEALGGRFGMRQQGEDTVVWFTLPLEA